MTFTPMDPSSAAAANANLSQLAAHGWSFLPSSGITRPAATGRSSIRPALPARVANSPAVLPIRRPFRSGWGAYPFNPFFYGGFGGFGPFGGYGGCFFSGFTNVCGYNPFLFNSGYCFSNIGFSNCGYGGYGAGFFPGYDNGYGYAPGPDYGPEVNGPAPTGPDESQNDSDQFVIDSSYVGNGTGTADQNPPAAMPEAPLAQIILKNRSAYEVTEYWVSQGELYYRPVTGGLNHVPVDQLDLSATVEANSRNGVKFQLTARPPQT
jgi:hypothetical protein